MAAEHHGVPGFRWAGSVEVLKHRGRDAHGSDGERGGGQRGGEHQKEFAEHQVTREMGLERMVSMVPRSFSPAVRSMAGYMAPVRHMHE